MSLLSQKANFVGDKYVYTVSDNDYDPYTMGFVDKDFTDISKIENIPSLDIRDSATGDLFYGPFGMTEWVRVPVDTDSMSTINTGTFRGIGTQSSSITDRNDNEDYNVNFR